MSIRKESFGTTSDGMHVNRYTLKNHNGMEVSFLDLGAVIYSVEVSDREGKFEDIALGYDSVKGYEVNRPSFGAPIGRYANRIAGAKFVLNGKEYQLDENDGTNCLHGGVLRYNHCMYEAECIEEQESDSITFARLSPDGEQGFPGNLSIEITYTLNDADELMIEYHAVCDEDTIINLTNHSYFNLGSGGHTCADVLEQEVQIFADRYTPLSDNLVPTGEIRDVEGTALDFREYKTIGKEIGGKDPAERTVTGYDHNFILNHPTGEVAMAARIRDPKSGRVMEVFTDLPGLQLYTAEDLIEPGGKDGMTYGNFCGACFESQNFPNAVNMEEFPNAVLRAGEEYSTVTVYRFRVE